MELLVYVLAKFAAYSYWSYEGVKLIRGSATMGDGYRFGLVRLILGVVFGTLVFMMYQPDPSENQFMVYLAIYIPLRWFEWSVLAKFIDTKQSAWLVMSDFRQIAWRLGGIAVSFGVDLLLWPGDPAARFCVGRCLC